MVKITAAAVNLGRPCHIRNDIFKRLGCTIQHIKMYNLVNFSTDNIHFILK